MQRSALTFLALLPLLLPSWSAAQPGSEEPGAFVIRKFRCISDALRKKVQASDLTWPGQDISAVSGVVYTGTGDERRALANTTLLVYRSDTLVTYSHSDSSGRYLIFLPVGNFALQTCKEGYLVDDHQVDVKRREPHIHDFDLQTIMANQTHRPAGTRDTSEGAFRTALRDNSSPKAPGRLRGTVTLVNNKFPLDQVSVALYQNGEIVRETNCDELGQYRFYKLEDGLYDIVIITDRDDNAPIPDIPVKRGKIKSVDVTLARNGKLKNRR